MAFKSTSFLLISALLVLSFSVSESRKLRYINRRSLFDPVALCEHDAHYAKICEEVVSHDHKITSPVSLVEATLGAAIVKAQKALTEVSGLMNAKSKDYQGMMGSALNACHESYDSTVDSLQKSLDILKTSGSHDDLMSELSAASTYVTTCQDSLDEVAEVSYPIQGLHINLDHHVSNCLHLGAKLLH